MSSLETRPEYSLILQQLKLLQGLGNLLRVQIVCTAVHMTGIVVREQCPFVAYSTYLMSKQSSQPL